MGYMWKSPKEIEAVVASLGNSKGGGYSIQWDKRAFDRYSFRLQFTSWRFLKVPMYHYPYLSGTIQRAEHGCIIEAEEQFDKWNIPDVLLLFLMPVLAIFFWVGKQSFQIKQLGLLLTVSVLYALPYLISYLYKNSQKPHLHLLNSVAGVDYKVC